MIFWIFLFILPFSAGFAFFFASRDNYQIFKKKILVSKVSYALSLIALSLWMGGVKLFLHGSEKESILTLGLCISALYIAVANFLSSFPSRNFKLVNSAASVALFSSVVLGYSYAAGIPALADSTAIILRLMLYPLVAALIVRLQPRLKMALALAVLPIAWLV